uniref:Uncharacterized protein n=1 Tax=Megaselia scalaris TaxID=36166 RepID=T1GA10_MEGSC
MSEDLENALKVKQICRFCLSQNDKLKILVSVPANKLSEFFTLATELCYGADALHGLRLSLNRYVLY